MTPETTNAPSYTSRANDWPEGVITDRANDPQHSESNVQEGITVSTIIASPADTVTPEIVKIPTCVVDPNLARFRNLLTEDTAPWLVGVGEPDPTPIAPCPAWCALDPEDHFVQEGYGPEHHRSQPIVVPYLMGWRRDYGAQHVFVPHFEVSLDCSATSTTGTAWVAIANERTSEGEGPFRQKLTGSEARHLARALVAAADLADPYSEFEEAGR